MLAAVLIPRFFNKNPEAYSFATVGVADKQLITENTKSLAPTPAPKMLWNRKRSTQQPTPMPTPAPSLPLSALTREEVESIMRRTIGKGQSFSDFLFAHPDTFARGFTGTGDGGSLKGLDGLIDLWRCAGGRMSHAENINYDFYAMVELMSDKIKEQKIPFTVFMAQWSLDDVIPVKNSPTLYGRFWTYFGVKGGVEGFRLSRTVTPSSIEVQTWLRLGGQFTTEEHRLIRLNGEWLPGRLHATEEDIDPKPEAKLFCSPTAPKLPLAPCCGAENEGKGKDGKIPKKKATLTTIPIKEIQDAVKKNKKISDLLKDSRFEDVPEKELPNIWSAWQKYGGSLTAVENLNLEYETMKILIRESINRKRAFIDFIRKWAPADLWFEKDRLFSPRITNNCLEVDTWVRLGGSLTQREQDDINSHVDYLQ
eukprot:CAMPEP_0167751080 /NCGR_PEP_ID=MMETSP0110_2-20121227/6360_1 /TAXON_ID=629695 /ORGANISM="Gymnochlora sp., Strain CCMP2014" /LENGTH=423 /DNA_ID=CAMNT_0007636497 /DNA_START=51 /DNA_END=1323 /DNA_ORIENTATION=-